MPNRFVAAVDSDTASSRAPACIFFRLVLANFKVADPSQGLPDIADLILTDSTTTGQQRLPEFIPVIAIGRSHTDSRDDDPLVIGQSMTFTGSWHPKSPQTRRQTEITDLVRS